MAVFRLLVLAFALTWAATASSAAAFANPVTHDTSAMQTDCPGHGPDTPLMDTSTCAVACYGLTATAVFDPVVGVRIDAPAGERDTQRLADSIISIISLVPTPPPDLA